MTFYKGFLQNARQPAPKIEEQRFLDLIE